MAEKDMLKEFSGGRVKDGVNEDRPWDSPVLKKKPLPRLTSMVGKNKPPQPKEEVGVDPMKLAGRLKRRNEEIVKKYGER